MLADFLVLDDWTVDYLGASVPAGDLAAFAARRRPELVALSVTRSEHLPALTRAAAAVRRASPSSRILAGGAGLGRRADAAALGVDAIASDARSGVQEARRLLGAHQPARGDEDEYFARLGHRVQTLRTARGWTQQQLADEAGLDRTYISGLEHGKQNPTVGALLRLAQALEAPIGRLIGPEP
jgi:DNA-binding XRE family transcriptional regulator